MFEVTTRALVRRPDETQHNVYLEHAHGMIERMPHIAPDIRAVALPPLSTPDSLITFAH